VSDIFSEVDEDLRREQFRKIWERYGNLILAVAVLIVVGVGGWRGWQWYEGKLAGEAGARFEAAVTLGEQKKFTEAEAAFNQIAAEGPKGYKLLARLRAADAAAARDRSESAKAFEAIAADNSLEQADRDLAAIRAAYIVADKATYDDMLKRLEPLAAPNRVFRHTARELLALSAFQAKNENAARQWIDTILSDATTPAGVRTRTDVLRALLPPAVKG
jgi:hypothetical protein